MEDTTKELIDIYENVKKSDVKKIVAKEEDPEEILKLLKDSPVKFLKDFINHESFKKHVTNFLKLPHVDKNNADLQLFVTALSSMIAQVKKK